ncbi:hypothetical protein GmHk_04G010400 [Glycine max]|nr:hypothetical protein GmHk_04G010400 [Glycine max]
MIKTAPVPHRPQPHSLTAPPQSTATRQRTAAKHRRSAPHTSTLPTLNTVMTAAPRKGPRTTSSSHNLVITAAPHTSNTVTNLLTTSTHMYISIQFLFSSTMSFALLIL